MNPFQCTNDEALAAYSHSLAKKTGYENRATWELKNMIKANSFLGALNTHEEDAELAKMKRELKQRKGAR